jgi:hypothetical protein
MHCRFVGSIVDWCAVRAKERERAGSRYGITQWRGAHNGADWISGSSVERGINIILTLTDLRLTHSSIVKHRATNVDEEETIGTAAANDCPSRIHSHAIRAGTVDDMALHWATHCYNHLSGITTASVVVTIDTACSHIAPAPLWHHHT